MRYVIAIAMLLMALLSLSSGMGAFLSLGPRAVLEKVAAYEENVEGDQVTAAISGFEISRRLRPLDASLVFKQAQLQYWALVNHQGGSAELVEYLWSTPRLYLSALAVRPTWGLAWARYAAYQASYRRDSVEHDVEESISKAMYAGPHEVAVLGALMNVSVAMWARDPSENRRALIEHVAALLLAEGQKGHVVMAVVRHGKTEEFRYLYDTDRRALKIERSLLKREK